VKGWIALTETPSEPDASDDLSYDAMREAIERTVPIEADREALIAAMEHLQSVEGAEGFDSAYEHFVARAEGYEAELGPFISWLSKLLGG
jgi:hypothetical protein